MSETEYVLRRMQLADVVAVHQLEEQIFPTPWSLNSYLFELERNPASQQWVIETKGEIAAYAVCWLLGGEEFHVANIAVAPAFRRQGLGRRLLAHVLAAGAELGASSAALEVRAGNVEAQALYSQFGFEVAAVRKGYYQDNHEDALLMIHPNLQAFLQPQSN